jgi:hypothetical protein
MPGKEVGCTVASVAARARRRSLTERIYSPPSRISLSEGKTMQDDFNPYAAPATTAMHPRAAEWLRSTDDPSLLKVARGLGMIYNGIITVILAVLLGAILGMVMAFAAGGGGGMLVLIVAGLAALIGFVMVIVGTLMCLATPEETGAKGFVFASVALYVVGFIASAIGQFMENGPLIAIGTIASLAANVLFLLFLKQLAEFIGALQLAERAKLLLILLGVTVGLQIVTFLGLFVDLPLLGLMGIAFLVISLVSFFLYLGLLDRLRKAIQSGGASYV